jgi:hypothetical protein
LQQISRNFPVIIRRLVPKKHHHTAGFFSFLVGKSVKILEVESAGRKLKDEDKIPLDRDVGGFRGVGQHTKVTPLATCWPLVEQVFYYFAEQVCSDLQRTS